MTNLINVEKSLKHWLKNKVTVTTATVVGFLIMGTVSFGVEAQNLNGQDFTLKENEIIEVNKKFGTGIFAQNSFKIKLEKGSTIDVQGSTTTDGIFINNVNAVSSIDNYGHIKSTVSGGGSASAISVRGNVTAALSIYNREGATLEANYIKGDGIGARAVVDLNPNFDSTGEVKFENNGTIIVSKGTAIALVGNSTVINSGTIILNDKESSAIKNSTGKVENVKSSGKIIVKGADKDFDINNLFTGTTKVEHTGLIENDRGDTLENKNSIYLSGGLSTSFINSQGNSVTLGKDKATKITTDSTDAIKITSLNIVGDVEISKSKKDITNNEVKIDNTTVNVGSNGIFKVGGKVHIGGNTTREEGSQLSITGNTLNKRVEKDSKSNIAVELLHGSTLKLTDVTFNGGVSSDENASNKLEVYGNTFIDGDLEVSNITIGTNGKAVGSDKLTLASTSKFTKATALTNGTTGTTVFQIDKDGNNALKNSTAKVTITGNMDFDTTNLTTDKKVELNGKNEQGEVVTHTLGNYTDKNTGVYTTTLDKTNNILDFKYNQNLFTNVALNNINSAAQIVNGNFSQDVAERETQLDKIYTQNIYTETVKAFYDTLKSTEHEVLSLNHETKAGELKADGKALYSKNEYTKDGVAGSYDVKAETSGLLASLEYGVTDTMRTGVVFAGSKQDLDTIGGKADADIFYLGVYGNKTYGNYDFTAGLGYQFGKYEADNNIGNVATSDKYDTNAFTGYVQGKYTFNFEDGLSIQPKAKLGYTYLKQDDAKDAYFGVSDAEITTYDTEVGVDVVKSVQFEKSKLDVTFGASYVRTMGDTDEMFKGHFYGDNTTTHFNVLGAELAENVIKFNLGAEVGNENGFFYNGGFTYEFGGKNTEAYGVNAGVGYKF